MKYITLIFLILLFPSTGLGSESFSHRDLVEAMKDAFPGKVTRVMGNSCEGVVFKPDSNLGKADCEAALSSWPARKSELWADYDAFTINHKKEKEHKREKIKSKLGLSDEDLEMLKEVLKD